MTEDADDERAGTRQPSLLEDREFAATAIAESPADATKVTPSIRLAFICFAVLLAGCSSLTWRPGSSEAPEDYRSFRQTSIVVHRGAQERPPSGARIGIILRERTIMVSTGCNGGDGRYRVEDGRLILSDGGLSMTARLCEPPLMERQYWVTHFISSRPRFTLDGDKLTLSTDDVTVHLVTGEPPPPDLPLVGTPWKLAVVGDGETVWGYAQETATLLFKTDGGVEVATACTSGAARFTVSSDRMRITDLPAKEAGCDAPANALETRVLEVLRAGDIGYELDSSSLTLRAGERWLRLSAKREP